MCCLLFFTAITCKKKKSHQTRKSSNTNSATACRISFVDVKLQVILILSSSPVIKYAAYKREGVFILSIHIIRAGLSSCTQMSQGYLSLLCAVIRKVYFYRYQVFLTSTN